MKNLSLVSLFAGLAGLVAGGVTAYYYKAQAAQVEARWQAAAAALAAKPPVLPAPVQPESLPPPPASLPAATGPDTLQLEALNQELAAVKGELELKTRQLAETQAAAARGPRDARPRGDWSNRLEELRTSDPALYDEIQQRRQESRRRSQEALAKKAAYLLKRDTSRMNQEEQEEYQLMVSLLTETWQLSERMRAAVNYEERRDVMRTLREKAAVLEPLLLNERLRTFSEIGRNMGYTSSQADEFANYLNEMVELTTLRNAFRSAPGSWFGGRPSDGSGERGGPPGR